MELTQEEFEEQVLRDINLSRISKDDNEKKNKK